MRKGTEYTLTKIYEGEIHYDVPGCTKVGEYAFSLPHENIQITDTGNGPAWEAYLVFRGENEKEIEAITRKVVSYIKKFKGHKFY